jgi:hypothetical protein
MKSECNVVRDLMPLVLDGIASAESRQLLEDHLAECPDCGIYYSGMKDNLSSAKSRNSGQEQNTFDKMARKMRKKRHFRVWRNVLIGLVVGMVVGYGILWGWSRLTQDFETLVYHGEYSVFLSQLQDGSVSVNIDYQGTHTLQMIWLEDHTENGKKILYVCSKRAFIKSYLDYPLQNYSCMRLSADELSAYDEIREGLPDEYVVVWKAGESIPTASQAMETYFALQDKISNIYLVETDDGKADASTHEDSLRLFELYDQADQVEKEVPEWQ